MPPDTQVKVCLSSLSSSLVDMLCHAGDGGADVTVVI